MNFEILVYSWVTISLRFGGGLSLSEGRPFAQCDGAASFVKIFGCLLEGEDHSSSVEGC